jgi:hypothetical protein
LDRQHSLLRKYHGDFFSRAEKPSEDIHNMALISDEYERLKAVVSKTKW